MSLGFWAIVPKRLEESDESMLDGSVFELNIVHVAIEDVVLLFSVENLTFRWVFVL